MPRVFDRNNPPACVRLPARPSATIFSFPAAGADGGHEAAGNRQSASPGADCRMPIAQIAAHGPERPHLSAPGAASLATRGFTPIPAPAQIEPEACGLRDLHASGNPPADCPFPIARHPRSAAGDVVHLGVGYAIGQVMTVAGILLCVAPGQELDVLAGAGTGLAVIVTVLAFVIGADRFATASSSASGGRRAAGVSPEANTPAAGARSVSPEAKE